MTSPADTLADRYGTRSRGRRVVVVVVAALVAVVFLGWLLWAMLGNANPAVSSREIRHEIVDDHTATIEVQVQYGDGPVDATCSLRAISHDKAIVGEITDWTPDPDAGSSFQEIEIRTDRRATTVEWIGCRTEGQARFR